MNPELADSKEAGHEELQRLRTLLDSPDDYSISPRELIVTFPPSRKPTADDPPPPQTDYQWTGEDGAVYTAMISGLPPDPDARPKAPPNPFAELPPPSKQPLQLPANPQALAELWSPSLRYRVMELLVGWAILIGGLLALAAIVFGLYLLARHTDFFDFFFANDSGICWDESQKVPQRVEC